MNKVDPQVYYDAAKKLTDIGTGIDNGTTKLVQALLSTGSMAGTSSEATAWATSYDTRANDTIDNARRLATSTSTSPTATPTNSTPPPSPGKPS